MVVDTTAPSKIWLAVLINPLGSNLHLTKPSCLLCGCAGRVDATLCPQMSATLQNWLHCQDMLTGLLATLICSLKFLVASASVACAYAGMLPEYFTESLNSNMENTAIKNDHMEQAETPGSNRLHLLPVD